MNIILYKLSLWLQTYFNAYYIPTHHIRFLNLNIRITYYRNTLIIYWEKMKSLHFEIVLG